MVSEKKEGTSMATGEKWEIVNLLLEFENEEGTHRIMALAFTDVTRDILKLGIKAGDCVDVAVRFGVRTYRTGFCLTEVKLLSICLSE